MTWESDSLSVEPLAFAGMSFRVRLMGTKQGQCPGREGNLQGEKEMDRAEAGAEAMCLSLEGP